MDSKSFDQTVEVLTEEQTAQVAGGLLIGPVLGSGGGCRTCTSGLPMQFKTEVDNFAK